MNKRQIKAELDIFHDTEKKSYGFVLYEQTVEGLMLKRGKLIDRSDSDCGGWKAAYCLGKAMSEMHGIKTVDVRAVTRGCNGVTSVTHTLFPWNEGDVWMKQRESIIVKVSVDGFLSEAAQLVYEESDFVWKDEQLRSLVFEELEEFFDGLLEEASNCSEDEKWMVHSHYHFDVERRDEPDE